MSQIQKNINRNFSYLLIFLLIQGMIISPALALNNPVLPEHLSPRININYTAFSDLIKTSYSDASKALAELPETNELNLLDISYQKKQRAILQDEIIDRFKQNYPDSLEQLEMIKVFFGIALEHYEEQQFESGEFYYNHCLEVAAIAAKNKAGFIEILAAIFHRMPTNKINPVIASLAKTAGIGKNKSESFRKYELVEINGLIKKFSKIADLKYYAHSQGANSIENFMGAVLNMMEGDPRIRRLVFADKEASIAHASETEKADIVKEIQSIYGPFAGRFGLFEIKKELENSIFKIHNPKGYELVMKKVRNTYGVDYKDLNDSLDKTKALIQKIADDNQIDAIILSRVKAPYRIYVKEKIAGKGKGQKDTLYGVDTIGIKVICKTEDCFYQMTTRIRQALNDKKLGNWKIGKIKAIASGITYINLVEIEGLGNLEVQFLTKEADDLREINFAHWSYEIARQTNRKQKFDKVEDFGFYQLREMYQNAIDDPERKDVDINTVTEEYFKSVYDHNKKWVYIFEKSSEIIDGREVDVVKPKRLAKGANGPVFAAQTGVDLFDKNYDGLVFYEWRGSKLVPKRRQYNDLNQLKDGDIVAVKTTADGLLDKLEKDKGYEANLFSSIRGFLRSTILLAQVGLSESDKVRYYKNAQSFLNKSFSQKGIVWGKSVQSKFPQNAKYMQNFLNEFAVSKKLKNSDELLMGLALKLINSSEVVDWAKERGADLLNTIQVDDPGIKAQVENIYGSLDKLFIEVGIGEISVEKVIKKLRDQQNVNVSMMPTISGDYSGRFEYSIEVREPDKKAISARTREIKARIKEILKTQGIELGEQSFNDKKSRKIKGGFLVNFEIPVRYEQLPNIRTALLSGLETSIKVKTKREKKDKEKALTSIGLIINVKNKKAVSSIIKRSVNIGINALKNYDFDEKNEQLSCVIEYDQMSYDLTSILKVLNVSLKNVTLADENQGFIEAAELQKKLKRKQAQPLENASLIESAI
ncbi:MAG: HD domain-containing protein [Candidatus Omnitrophota bacterium]